MNRKSRDASQPMYVYDRVCPREAKRREILREYGTAPGRQRYDRNSTERPPRPSQNGTAYSYRPGKAQGGEAVRENPLKMFKDRVIHLFETVEERGRMDETIAKRQAIAWKKLVEHRWTIFITLILLAVAVLFAALVYSLVFVIQSIEIGGSELYTDTEIMDAAGFSPGDNLYSFDSEAAKSQITFCLPMIRSAEIDQSIPNAVAVTVTEDEPTFQCEIWGETLILSAGLRVLGTAQDETALPTLVLPPVDYSVAGRVLSFRDERDERYIRSVLGDVLASELWSGGMVNRLDLSDEYDLTVNLEQKYIVRLGGEDDCAHKLKLVYKTIGYNAFNRDMPARIDVRSGEKAAVNYDPALIVE